MIQKGGHLRNILLLISISFVFFMLGNNILSLTNPDEVFYSLSAKEMIQHKTWLVPQMFNQPQFEKPILTFWLLRLSFCLFGITSFAARFPPALFAMLGCLTVYYFCQIAYKNKDKSFLCALILMSSGLYIGLARFLLTDMIFSIFILMSLTAFYTGYIHPKHKTNGILLFFIFCALAVLTKGLLGVVLPILTVVAFLIIQKNLKFLKTQTIVWGSIVFLILALPWYVFMLKQFGQSFISEFFYNDHIRRILEAEHSSSDTWYFYPLTMTLGMLPWTIFLISSLTWFIRRLREKNIDSVYHFLASWILVMFVVLQMAHSKLASYIFPVMPALAIITGDYIFMLLKKNKSKSLLIMIMLSSLLLIGLSAGLFLVACGLLPIDFKYYQYLPDKKLVIELLVLFLALTAAVIFTLFTKRQKQCLYILALQVPLILMFGLVSKDKFENYVSSQTASEYLLMNHQVENKILCSKMFVRAVRYYTNKDIALIGGQFFSPHPIETVSTDQDVSSFLNEQGTTYAIVQKSQFKTLQKISKDVFNFNELLHVGDTYVLQISRK